MGSLGIGLDTFSQVEDGCLVFDGLDLMVEFGHVAVPGLVGR